MKRLGCLVIMLAVMLPLCVSAEGSVYRACKHKNTEIRDAGYAYGVDGCINDKQHVTEHCYEEYCFDCIEVIASGWWDSGEHNPLWEGYWEDHIFDANGECVCGYYKEPSEITEPLKVTISDWYREATVGMSIGATAKISGGSGQYTCKWVATSNQNKRAQSKPEKTTTERVSWGITPASEGTWKITLTVQDRETGEKVSAVTRNIYVVAPKIDPHYLVNRDINKWNEWVYDKDVFDYNNIWKAVYLNDTKAADMKNRLGSFAYVVSPFADDGNAGHAAVMLIDKNNNSVYFSVNGTDFDGTSNIGFSVRYFGETETDRFLNTGKMKPMMYRTMLHNSSNQNWVFVSDEYLTETYEDADYEYIPIPSDFIEKNKQAELKQYVIENNLLEGTDDEVIKSMTLYVDDSDYHYNRAIIYPTTAETGREMYKEIMRYCNGIYPYDFLDKNCDYYALAILDKSAYVDARMVDFTRLPNTSYFTLKQQAILFNEMFDTDRVVTFREN